MSSTVPDVRIRRCNDAPVRADGRYVLYWMIAARRTSHHFGLQRAADWARHLGLPLVVFEPLRAGYRWASDRMHAFVIQGMVDNARACAAAGVTYVPYVEPEPGAGKGMLAALADDAAVVVTDLYPCFFIPRMVTAAAEHLDVRLDAVDGNGLLPLAATDRVFTTAYSFRRYLQKTLPPHLEHVPDPAPLDDAALAGAEVSADVLERWPPCRTVLDAVGNDAPVDDAIDALLASLPIDHDVHVVRDERGGAVAADARTEAFLDARLPRYADERNQPDDDVASHLSSALHFGHLSIHDVFARIVEREGWSPTQLGDKAHGKREGWWGMGPAAEAFLDEIVTWREIGHVFSWQRPDDYDQLASLPDWALTTIAEHADDERPTTYTLEQLDAAETHDELWNAAQRQLVDEGRIHNYLRMLWGKLIYQWSPTAQDALDAMVELNNRYALDGRDPNSYSGIFWVLGRFDRAWGPERYVFGKLRYMTSKSTRSKLRVGGYVERHLAT